MRSIIRNRLHVTVGATTGSLPLIIMDITLVLLYFTGSFVFPLAFLTCTFLLRGRVQQEAIRFRIATSLVSILQALMASTVGAYVVANCYQDFLYARCWLVDVYMSFGAPYMLYDIGAMYAGYHANIRSRKQVSWRDTALPFLNHRRLVVFHHILIGVVCFLFAMFFKNDRGDFFFGCMFLTELSTPFINLRMILLKLGKAGTHLYQMNNLVILVVFFICRILTFPIIFWVYGWGRGVPLYHVPLHIPWHCTAGCLALAAFQVFWYVKFIKTISRYRLEKVINGNKRPYTNGSEKLHPNGVPDVKES